MSTVKFVYNHRISMRDRKCENCGEGEAEIVLKRIEDCCPETEIKESIMSEKKAIDDIETRFNYHKPHGNQPERYNIIRQKLKEMAYFIIANTPKSTEQDQAITNLEKAMFWANASIARNEKESS